MKPQLNHSRITVPSVISRVRGLSLDLLKFLMRLESLNLRGVSKAMVVITSLPLCVTTVHFSSSNKKVRRRRSGNEDGNSGKKEAKDNGCSRKTAMPPLSRTHSLSFKDLTTSLS